MQTDGAEREENKGLVVMLVIDDCVGAGVKGVCGDGLAPDTIELGDDSDYVSGDVVEVEDWRVGVEADGVEGVGVAHSQGCERGEVSGSDGGEHLAHALRDKSVCPVGE